MKKGARARHRRTGASGQITFVDDHHGQVQVLLDSEYRSGGKWAWWQIEDVLTGD